MTHRSWKATARSVAVMCGIALALGAYGLGSGAASAATKTKAKFAVATATVPGVGTILVDSKGHALYTHTDGSGAAVACTGACATAWPPLTATGAKVKAAKGVKALSTTGATHQVTATGLPLYRFSLDTQAKQAKGEGVNAFGGTWHVVTLKKTTTKDTPTTNTPTTNAGTGGVSF
jgi:predicted lipoprotein with Yx(FWY)xxD motif